MALQLLQTKLYAPMPRLHLVRRERLVDRLLSQGKRPLTLIAAPAGFGKTTLVSEWIVQDDQKVAWLSLDNDDNDPARFLTYLIAALQTCQAAMGETALTALAAPQAPPAKALLTLLINELGTLAAPLTLVLDDYHVITAQPIHEALTFLIDHLPPHLRLIITTRVDPPLPLARWRVRNQLADVRADDLRFTPLETATFLNDVMGLTLSAAEITALETRTEGWIAGLQLAALSMQGRADVSGFIQAFSGSNRHVLSYLVEEVLNQRPEGTLDFLLQTSILDRLTAPLCNAVTGRSDSQPLLEKLEQANLFLIPLDDEGRWYRYHHLFAEVLRTRLQQSQPEALPMLHRRASTWFAAHYQLDRAMHHALASTDLDLAATLVEEHATTLMLQSQLVQLRNWVVQLPDDLIQTRPRLLLAQGWVLALVGQLPEAEKLLTSAPLQSLTLPADVAGELALLRAVIAGFQSDPTALTWAQQALALLPLSREDLRVTALNEIGLAYMRADELASAQHTLLEAAQRAEAEDIRFIAVDALTTIRIIQARRGQLLLSVQTCQQALAMVTRWASRDRLGAPPATGMIYVGLGEVLVEWNDLTRANEALDEGLRLLQATIEKFPLARGYSALARVQQAHGDWDGALTSFAQGEAWFVQMQIPDAPALAWLVAQRARLWLRQGNLSAVVDWAAQCADRGDIELSFVQNITRVRLWLAQTRQSGSLVLLDDATKILTAVLSAAEVGEWTGYVIESRLLQALILHAQNDAVGAALALEQGLTLAEPGGYIRLFIDEGEPLRFLISHRPSTEQNTKLSIYVNKLLAGFDNAQSTVDESVIVAESSIQNLQPKLQNTLEPLSDREREVLQWVAAGLSNSEIAAKLIISTSTVKTHINHLFGKLGAQSRTQAVVRARELGLLNG